MVLVSGNWKMWLVGMAVSLGIFAVLYFTVIQPDNNTANQALKTGLQQSQQVETQAQQQLSNAANQAGASSSAAHKTLNKAAKLTACVSAAGTDTAKIAACQAQFN